MAYIPAKPIPNQPIPGVLSGYTNGTIYNMDYTLHLNAIAFEINQLSYALSPIGITSETGGFGYYVQSIAINSGIVAEQMVDLNLRLQDLIGTVSKVGNKSEILAKGLGTISSHLAEQVVTQQMVAVDTINNNKFTQETTKASQKAAGQEPTVITPASLVETTKETVNNVTMFKAQAAAGALVSDAVANASSYAITTTTTWIAESAFGQWVKDAYAETEIFVVGIFSKERAAALRAKTKLATRVGQA